MGTDVMGNRPEMLRAPGFEPAKLGNTTRDMMTEEFVVRLAHSKERTYDVLILHGDSNPQVDCCSSASDWLGPVGS